MSTLKTDEMMARNAVQGRYEDAKASNGADLLSARTFNLIMGGCLLWGFAVNVVMCTTLPNVFLNMNPIALLIGYMVMAIAGVIINKKSDKPLISFIGYNLVVLPLGAVLTVILAEYNTVTIQYAFIATTVVTAAMMAAATAKPDFFLRYVPMLTLALIVTIVVELVLTLVLGSHLTIFDYLVAIIFCGYIGYDFVKAQYGELTVDNAVDGACALYLDIVNLFIRLLAIFGRRD